MSNSLAHRFQFGANLPVEAYIPGTPEYSLTFGSVEREQKLLNLVNWVRRRLRPR